MHRTWLVCLAFLVSLPVLAGQRISGVVFTETKVEKITVRAWALGQALVAKPALAKAPLAEVMAAPANGFTLELPDDALPVRVDVAAPGHLGAAFTVALPEQASLPPVWLPAGSELRVRVVVNGRAAAGAQVWGSLRGRNPVDEAGRWQPVVPITEVDGKGEVRVWVPAQGTLTLSGRSTDGRWGALPPLRLPALGARVVRLDSRTVAVTVRTPRGDPAAGILVTGRNAPAGSARVTDDKGKVTVQAAGEGEVAILAVGGGLVGTALRHTPPAGGLTLALEPAREVRVQVFGTRGPVLLDPAWVPSALRGGAPLVARGGRATIPFFPGGGSLTAWGVGVASQQLRIRGMEAPVAVRFAPAATVEGVVVEAEEAPVSGVPVWCAQPPRFPGVSARMSRARGATERPLLPWAVSRAGGGFTIDGLSTGPLRLTALKAGAPPADSGPLTLAAGATARVTLRLVKGTWLALQAVDPDGRALRGVSARAFRNEEGRAGSMWRSISGPGTDRGEPIAAGSSDDDGALRLQPLPSGNVSLELVLSGYVTRWLDVEVPEGGKDAGPQVLEPGMTVSGRVVDESGKGVADADVYASTGPWGGPEFGPPAARSDPFGAFALPDRPRQGEIFLEARGEGVIMSQPVKVALPPPGPVELWVRRARTLEGRVLDERSAEPVPGARVSASRAMRRSTGGSGTLYFSRGGAEGETDEAGLFRLEGLETGDYTVWVSASGYRQAQLGATLPDEGQPKPLTVALKRGVAIRGRVVDTQGAPAPGVDVYADPAARQMRSSTAGPSGGSASTGPDGSFAIEGLDAGRYEVVAEDETGAQAREMADAGGAEEVVLRLKSPGGIQGRVASSDGTPVAGARVATISPGGLLDGERATDASGGFSFEDLPPGRYTVTASDDTHPSARQQVAVEPGLTSRVELVFKPGGVVLGSVRGLSPEELKACQVFSDAGSSAFPEPDGSFRLEGIPVGVSRVTGFVLSSTKQRTAPVEVKDLDTPATVTLDFSTAIAIAGSVRRGGRPAQGIGVQAQPVGQGSGSGTVTDQEGQFEIKGLDPGSFVVSALDDQGRTLASQRVSATTDTRVDLVVPGGSLAGRVTDAASGSRVAEATVRATQQGEGGQPQVASTDDAGSFAFHELADGAFVVRAEAPGYSPGEAQASVSMGQAPDVAIALQPEQHLTLIVRDADGSVPDQVYLTPMRDGRVLDVLWARCDREGRAVITTLAPGVYTLRVGSWQGGAIIRAVVPGPDLAVGLLPNGTLGVAAPPGPGAWRVRLVTGGLVVPMPSWQGGSGGEWAEIGSAGLRLSLPAGGYLAQTVAPDGTVREQQVAVPPGGELMIRPEGP